MKIRRLSAALALDLLLGGCVVAPAPGPYPYTETPYDGYYAGGGYYPYAGGGLIFGGPYWGGGYAGGFHGGFRGGRHR